MNKQTQMEFANISRLFQAGKIKQAKAAVDRALLKQPRAFFLHNMAGAIDGTMGNWQEARKHFQKAVKIHPKSFEAFRNLGNADRALGDLTAAQKHLIKALQINPRFATGWCSIGNVYQDKGQIEKALDAFRKALKIKPDFPEAAIYLMEQLDRSNLLEELREAINHTKQAMPSNPIVILFEGVMLDRGQKYEAAKEKLDSLYFDSTQSLADASLELMRLNRLAKINDHLLFADDAYAQFLKANALNKNKLASPRVSASRYVDGLDARLSYYQPGFSKRWEHAADTSEAPVFMVGFPRSGTTLLDTFLRGHSEISVIEEAPFVYEIKNELGVEKNLDFSILDAVSPEKLAAVGKAYLHRKASAYKAPITIDKLPLNLAYAGEILRVFPNAKFIFSIRDPADAVFSAFMQSFKLNDAMATFDTPENAANTYDKSFKIWNLIVDELGPQVITCKYEDLISAPEQTIERLVEFLGVEMEQAMLEHQKTANSRTHISTSSYAQVVQPLYTSAKGRWERYAHLMPEAVKILAPWRKEFGYSD